MPITISSIATRIITCAGPSPIGRRLSLILGGCLTFVGAASELRADQAPLFGSEASGSKTEARLAANAPVESRDREKGKSSRDVDSREYRARDQRDLEEVIVTAQKREEKLKDVPISIGILGGDSLDKSFSRDLREEISRVPGVAFGSDGIVGERALTVRGVSPGPGAAIAAFYLDSVPFSFVKGANTPEVNVYDLERVEILRGPQGTLYGANALNGVIRVLTQDPNLRELGFKGRILGSAIKGGSEGYQGDMAINIPLVPDKLAVRTVLGYQNLGGWIDRPLLNEQNANTSTIKTGRLKIAAQPADQVSIVASAWISRDHRDSTSFSLDGKERLAPQDEPTDTDFDAYNMKVSYDMSGFSITSATSYIDWANNFNFYSALSVPAMGVLENSVFSEELTLASNHKGAWRWNVGGMYRDAKDRVTTAVPDFFFTPEDTKYRSRSTAIFGELTRVLVSGFELTAGLRYFEDKYQINRLSAWGFGEPFTPEEREDRFHATTPRVVLAWRPSPSISTYLSYAEGFRSGLSQSAEATALGFGPVDPDKLKNYEMGAKGDILSGRLSFDAAVYYTKWSDVQQSLLVISPVTGFYAPAWINGRSVSGPGVDLGVSWRPASRLTLEAGIGWNGLQADDAVETGGVVLINKGARIDLSPETTTSASASYEFGIGAGFNARLFTSANTLSRQRSTTVTTGQRVINAYSDRLLFVRAGCSVSTPQGWEITLFGDNINNEEGLRNGYDPTVPNPYTMRTQPRTISLQLDYRL